MAETIRLRSGPLELMLAPAIGGSIARFDRRENGRTVALLRGSDSPQGPLDAGCFPLVPYCNRIRDGRFRFRDRVVTIAANMPGDRNPLHGTGWLAPWAVVAAAERTAELHFDHPRGEWPWAFDARQAFALADDHLLVELSCTNRDDDPMPCGLGLHPYFPCDSATRLATGVANVWTVDRDVLPVDHIPATGRYDLRDGPACGRDLDNGFDGWSGLASLYRPDAGLTVELSSEARYFQLYSPAKGGLFVAEPVSHANAALNEPEERWPGLGLRVLAPGETMRLSMTLRVSPDAAI